MKVYPCNRFFLVQPKEAEEKPQSAVLLPDDFVTQPNFSTAMVLSHAPDCKMNIDPGEEILYQTNMLEEVEISNNKYYLLLENHILCVLAHEE